LGIEEMRWEWGELDESRSVKIWIGKSRELEFLKS
jgi:hypothetical protein